MSRIALSLCLSLAAACAGAPAAFSAKYPDNVEEDLTLLAARLSSAPPHTTPPIAVGVATQPRKLYAYDLSARRLLWQLPAAPSSVPVLAGDAVVTQEGDLVVARELDSGTTRFAIGSSGMSLVGADGDDSRVVLTLVAGVGTYAKSRIVLMQGGAARWERRLDAPAGAPALVGATVLVPWSNQYLSGLTADAGDELARLRVRDAVLAHAFVENGAVFAGSQHGIGQLSREIVSGTLKAGPFYDAPKQDLPGRPLFLRDPYASKPLAAPDGAQNRIRLAWTPEVIDAKHVGLAGDNLYLAFYRFVFALDPSTLDLHWVYAHPRDLVGARAQRGGLVIADDQGEVRFLGARSGRTQWFEQTGLPSVDVELPSVGAASRAAAEEPAPDPNAVRQQLVAAAQDADARLVPMRLLAIELLAKWSDAEATANMLGMCEDPRTTAPVRKAACAALKERKSGTDYVITALQRHASYLDGVVAPPVGALAKAAATQGDKRATPLLVAHLQDPNTESGALPAIVAALADLGDDSAAAALSRFLALYHADAIDEDMTKALVLVPDALVKLQGAAAREALVPIDDDGLTMGLVRERVRRALSALDEQAKAAEKNEEAEKLAAEQAAQKAEAAKTAKPNLLPTHITIDIIKQALLPVRDKLQACVQGAKPEAFQARLVLVIEDGQLLMVSVLPEHLQACIEPLVRAQKFPATRTSKRERISYTVKRY